MNFVGKRNHSGRVLAFVTAVLLPLMTVTLVDQLLLSQLLAAQNVANDTSGSGSSTSSATTVQVPRLVRLSGTLTPRSQSSGSIIVNVTFSLYAEETGGPPLWQESQNVELDATGHYTVLLGSTQTDGLPVELFTSGRAQWLGLRAAGEAEQSRIMLVSVPFALKAGDAETLGGKPASAYITSDAFSAATTGLQTAGQTISPVPSRVPRRMAIVADSTAVTTPGGTVNQLAVFDGTADITSSIIFDNGTGVGIGNTSPAGTLDVSGTTIIEGKLQLPATGTASSSTGYNSNPLDLSASAFDGSNVVSQDFLWIAEPTNNNSPGASAALNLQFGANGATPSETGLSIAANGIITFAPNQTFPGAGAGTISQITAGAGLAGGGTSGNVTLNLDTTQVPTLRAAGNSFTGAISAQSFTGNGSGLTNLNASNLSIGTVPASALSGTYSVNISGNAATATSAVSSGTAATAGGLAASPVQCSAGFATGIAANGNANCAALTADLGSLTYSPGGATTFAAAGAVSAAAVVIATHSTATTFIPTQLVKWGSYQVEILQDSTGGHVTFTLGTTGACSTWKVSGGGSGAITLTSSANAVDVLFFTFDGTNCVATLLNNFS